MGTAQGVTIRQATLDDAPALRRYLAEIVAEQLPVFLPLERFPTLEEEQAFISGLVDHETSTLLLAWQGQELAPGERFGMIKFGSRTELYVPLSEDMECVAQIRDKVRAGVTPLVRYGRCRD